MNPRPEPIKEAHLKQLRRAVKLLERNGPASKSAATALGAGKALARVPAPLKRRAERAMERTALLLFKFVLRGPSPAIARPPRRGMGVLLAGLSGSVGGALGPSGVLIELPLIAFLILRSIVAIARHCGEDLSTAEGRLACIEVFALGSGAPVKRGGYFAARAKISGAFGNAAYFVAERSAASISSPLVGRVFSQAASGLGLALSERMAVAGSLPLIGAIAGGATNAFFMHYFQNLATAHFTVRRLERLYGVERIKTHYCEIQREMSKR
jgi:hypothetical protein